MSTVEVSEGPSSRKDPKAARFRVAVADDDRETLDLLCLILDAPDTDILRASTGAELAVRLTKHGPFDLVVTDIDMPWMEGLDVVKALRAAQMDVPVVVVSGLARPEIPELVKALGNALFLQKPIVVAEFRRAVARLVAARV